MHSAELKKTNCGDPKSQARKPSQKASLLGQVFTPPSIALRMSRWILKNRPTSAIEILDPCVGPGTFPVALLKTGLLGKGDRMVLVDLDPEMIDIARENLSSCGLRARFLEKDFLSLNSNNQFDAAILNPPYIRQEWIDRKGEYKSVFQTRYDIAIPGTSNLYVYFLVQTLLLLKPGGKFACIVYDSWQSTIFGRWLQKFLYQHCESLEFHPVHDQPFNGRLIDAVIIYGVKRNSSSQQLTNVAKFEHVLETPFSNLDGFCRLATAIETRRGLRLKQADFFICDLAERDRLGAIPFVKKLNGFSGFTVPKSHPEAALIITAEDKPRGVVAELNRRLQKALKSPEQNVPILTWHRERPEVWSQHREPRTAPMIFNYYLRKRPRHLFNDRAYSDNFYGLTPILDSVPTSAWLAVMNSTAVSAEILAHSRNQGSGLAKIQLFEYRRVSIPDLSRFTNRVLRDLERLGSKLQSLRNDPLSTINEIDEVIYRTLGHSQLQPSKVRESYNTLDIDARKPKEIEAARR